METVTTENIIKIIRGLIKDLEKTNGNDIHTYDTDTSFPLSQDYVSSTSIKVYQNGTELTSGWSYNSDTNRVTITASLTKNDQIMITYNYYCKYSDSEILNYVSANLVRFVEYRYSKYFYVNDSDEIVSMGDLDPTVEEGSIIAFITAIDIDPNNINIKTSDFNLGAEESMSKQEQIQDVFTKWLKNYGILSFLEIE